VRARSHCVAVLCAVMGAWLARSGSLCNERSSAPYGTAGHTLNRPLARRWGGSGSTGRQAAHKHKSKRKSVHPAKKLKRFWFSMNA
jgi:hypothetical protein